MKSMSSSSSSRGHVQIFASIAANLCQHAVGHCVPMSSYILPQLVDSQDDHLTLSQTQGSWFGKISIKMVFGLFLSILFQPQYLSSEV